MFQIPGHPESLLQPCCAIHVLLLPKNNNRSLSLFSKVQKILGCLYKTVTKYFIITRRIIVENKSKPSTTISHAPLLAFHPLPPAGPVMAMYHHYTPSSPSKNPPLSCPEAMPSQQYRCVTLRSVLEGFIHSYLARVDQILDSRRGLWHRVNRGLIARLTILLRGNECLLSQKEHIIRRFKIIFFYFTQKGREGGVFYVYIWIKWTFWGGISIYNLDIHVSADLHYAIGRFQYFM